MERRAVHLRIAGQTYKVVSTASEEDLHRLARLVDARVRELVPSHRPVLGDAIVLAALSFAHDLETERERRTALEAKTRDVLERSLSRIDSLVQATEPPESDEKPDDFLE